ncbi:MAG: cbb3-type cytochrome c oxidase subunit I [Candidatus Nanopelagicales bacterium]
MPDPAETITERHPHLLSRTWAQAAGLVAVIGFFVLILMGFMTYQSSPPMPEVVVSSSGQTVFTGEEITAGQGVFLRNGLMEYGTIYGQGGYLGPDYTADYLHRAATAVQEQYGGPESSDAIARTIQEFRTNTYDEATGTLTISDAQAQAFADLTELYATEFGNPDGTNGLRPSAITDPEDIHNLTAYFAYTAWTAATQRPGSSDSYTNNWPGEDLVANAPTGNTMVWSIFSLAALLCGAAALFAVFGRWNRQIGWQDTGAVIRFRPPDQITLTGTQRATAWFFFVMAALFLVQTLVGAAAAHYRADLTSFFGLPLADLLPFNLVRTWHVQLSLFWVSTSFLAAGIFLVPMITRQRDRKGQTPLAYMLLGALVIVVVGSLIGEFAGQRGAFGDLWSWLGNQGFEYLDLGKLWQILLTVGMVLWVVILWRGLRKRLRTESALNMPWMFFYAALALPAVYALGLLAQHQDRFPITDFWRFMVVHLWVEDFLELFTTVMVAFIFVLLGVVREKVALGVIFLDIILYSAGGVIGTAHHWYWTGTPAEVLSLGAFFSAMEVIPLLFLSIEAWSFIRVGGGSSADGTPFPHKWAVMFLIAVGFWNFLGAGVFGFLINLPIVSYYEVGTALTANHGHAAMMGVYGMLAVGFAVFALKYFVPPDRWSERRMRISFWSLNIGLAWMVFVSLFPLGVLQLYESVDNGYASARSMAFNFQTLNTSLEWLRLPGDAVFIVGGVLPLLWLTFLGIRFRGKHDAGVSDDDLQLFTEESPSDDPAPAGSAAGS